MKPSERGVLLMAITFFIGGGEGGKAMMMWGTVMGNGDGGN